MDWRKDIELFRQVAVVAVGQAVGVGAMYGVFALLGSLDAKVLLGGLAGALLALGNFIAMAISVVRAAKKAEQQQAKAGQLLVQGSYMLRMVVLFLALFLLARTGYFHVVALAVPLAFTRPALSVWELMERKGEKSA